MKIMKNKRCIKQKIKKIYKCFYLCFMFLYKYLFLLVKYIIYITYNKIKAMY